MQNSSVYNIENRICIRPIEDSDTDYIIKWRNTDFVRNNFIFRETFTRQMHETWMREKVQVDNPPVKQFIIEELPGNNPVGCVYLRDVDYEKKTAEYGVFLGEKEALGKGYGTMAARWSLSYAKDVLGLRSMILRVFADNEPAIRSYKNAGFYEIEYKKDFMTDESGVRDLIIMERQLADEDN